MTRNYPGLFSITSQILADIRPAERSDGADAGRRRHVDLGEVAVDDVDADERQASLSQSWNDGAYERANDQPFGGWSAIGLKKSPISLIRTALTSPCHNVLRLQPVVVCLAVASELHREGPVRMADLVLKMFQFLIEKFAFASKYIVAAFVGAVLLVAIFGYFFGRQMLEPRIDYYLMTKINAYFEGEAGLLASAKQVDPKIKNVATEKLKTITESLYDEVDAVYPISNSVTRADLEKLGTKSSLNVPLYVYADLKKHRVLIFLNRRQLSFDYKICFNGTKLGPRILEDPSRYLIQQFSNDNPPAETYYRKIDGKVDQQPVYPGIPDVPSSYVKYLRAAFAIDEPGRQSDQNKDRDVARNGYILVTTTPAGYWDLQDLFKSAEFYANEMYAPRWAVNLPGDDYAALIYSDPSKNSGSNAIEVGDVALRQASALAIVARK